MYGIFAFWEQQPAPNGVNGQNGVRPTNPAEVESESDAETAQNRHIASVGGRVKDLHLTHQCVILTNAVSLPVV